MRVFGKSILSVLGLFAAVALFILSGCHTMEGVGRDVEAVGGGVADTADSARPYQ